MARTYTAVVTDEGRNSRRCGHNHHTASAAYRCGDKNRQHFAVLQIEASDGQPVTLGDFAVSEADYREANWKEWVEDIAEYLSESLNSNQESYKL
jgi:hypothetical protein